MITINKIPFCRNKQVTTQTPVKINCYNFTKKGQNQFLKVYNFFKMKKKPPYPTKTQCKMKVKICIK